MTTNRRYVRRRHRGELTHWQEMELWLGPSHRGSAFGSRAELHQAWLKHRERLMTVWAQHGKRPCAWWEFEAPFPRPFERERSMLYEAGLLTETERAELEAEWHAQFEKAWAPDFFHCDGPGRFFSGALGRRKHFDWADIPASLVKEWTLQRKRRGQTIDRLGKAVTEAVVVDEPVAG